MKKTILCAFGLALATALSQAQTKPPPLPPAMTLQALPAATLAQWYSLWQQNIIGDYQWEAADVITTNWGDGFLRTDPTTGDNIGAGESIDWQLAPVLYGLYWGYMATSDTQYVDDLVVLVDQLISVNSVAENTSGMFVEPDGYPGWPALGGNSTDADNLNSYYADSMLADGAVGIPITLMAQQMISNPQLVNNYAAKGQTYLNLTKTLYQKWISRGGWRNTTIGPGNIAVVLPYGINSTGTAWIDYATRNDPGNGFSEPCNKSNEIAMWLLAMYDATSDQQYLNLAQLWFTQMKYRMTLNADGSYAIWNYWQPAGLWDYVGGNPANGAKLWIGAHPNNGYYQIDTQAIVQAYQHGVVFTAADIAALVKTAKTSWTPSAVAWGSAYVQYYFDPSTLQPGMSVSYALATATAQANIGCTQILCGCWPNSFTAQASAAWSDVQFWVGDSNQGTSGVVNGTIVSTTWNGTTGTTVIQPYGTSGAGAQVTVTTDNYTEVFLLRLWTALMPYDTEIQQQFESNEDTNPNLPNEWGAAGDSYYLTLHAEQDGVYVGPTGSALVTLSPAGAVSAGAEWNVDGGPWQSNGVTLSGLSIDNHTVYFSTVAGYGAPDPITITITAGQTTSATGTYTPQYGSLTVTLLPTGAVDAGAQWDVDGEAWQGSGVTVSGLSVGSHTINYNTIAGWNSPASVQVTISNNTTTTATGTYTQQTGSVQVMLLPAAAVTAGAQWNVDGLAWQASGATVSGLAVGNHTINYNTIAGWNSPSSVSVSIINNNTAVVTGTYVQQTGSVQVTLLPAAAVTAGAQWNVDGLAWQASGATVSGLAVGTHTVNYNTVLGWTSPASATVTITYNGTATVTGTYVQQFGSLKVTLLPAAAVTAGAQWNVDGQSWQASGATVSGLAVGVSHTVNFKTIPTWNSPATVSPTISFNQTTSITATYTQQTGSLQVTLEPHAAQASGRWKLDNGNWEMSGAILSGLTVGVTHTVFFKPIAYWNSPAPVSVTIAYNTTTTLTATYVEQTGSIQVTLQPAAAVTAGAQWNVDEGPWQNSGAIVSGLAAGYQHEINYKAIPNWNVPSYVYVTVTYKGTAQVTGTYTPQTGSLRVVLGPAAAVTAGARWRVDGGPWQKSGVIIGGLAIGTHAVTFNTIANWISPAPISPTIVNNTMTYLTETYVQATGSVQLALAPTAAVMAGARWRVDGGAWQNSGAIVTALSVGTHVVDYLPLASCVAPPSEPVLVVGDQITYLTRVYATDLAAPTVARMFPAAGAWNASRYAVIALQVTAPAGLDATSVLIEASCNQAAWETIYSGATAAAIAGGFSAYDASGNAYLPGKGYSLATQTNGFFLFQPSTPFDFEENVSIRVSAADLFGNAIAPPFVSGFTTEARYFGWNRRVDGGTAGDAFPAAATDGDGNIWVAWERTDATTQLGSIWLAELADDAGKFGAEIPVTITGDCHKPAVAIAADGTIYVAYEVHAASPANDVIAVSSATTSAPTAWTSLGAVTGTTFTLRAGPAMTVDSADKVYVAGVGLVNGVEQVGVGALARGAGAWSVTQVTSDAAGDVNPAVAIDAAGVVYAVWTHIADGNLYGADSSTAWTTINQVTSAGNAGSPAIATEASGNVLHFVWTGTGGTPNPAILYGASSGAWTGLPLTGASVLDGTAGISDAANPKIAVTGSGATARSLVLWQDRRSSQAGDTDIMFAQTKSDGTFGTNIRVSKPVPGPGILPVVSAVNPALGVAENGTPCAAWSDLREAGASHIYFAKASCLALFGKPSQYVMPLGANLTFIGANPHLTEVDLAAPANAFNLPRNVSLYELQDPPSLCPGGCGLYADGSGLYLSITGGTDDPLGGWLSVAIHLPAGFTPPSPLTVYRLVPPAAVTDDWTWTLDSIRNVSYDPITNVLAFETLHLSSFGVGAAP